MSADTKPGILTRLRIKRVAMVDLGANLDRATGDGAHIMLYKRHDVAKDGPGLASVHSDSPDWDMDDCDEYEKATLTGESRRTLPDSAFAAVWTDAKGKHRKLPIHDAGHLAAARGRVDAADIPADVKAKAKAKIEAATHKPEQQETKKMKLKDVLKLFTKAAAEPDADKRALLLKAADEATEKLDGVEGEDKTDPAHLDAMKASVGHMRNTMKAFGPGPHPPTHPIHAMKAAHDQMVSTLKAAGVECESDEPGGLDHVPAAVGKRFTELEKANTELQKRLDVEINKAARIEVAAVLKSFRAVPFELEGDTNDIDKYLAIKTADPKVYDSLIAKFRAVDEQMAASAAFQLVGKGGSGGRGDAWAQIEAKALGLMEKAGSGSNLTKAAAIDRICADPENAKLVAQYREQQQ